MMDAAGTDHVVDDSDEQAAAGASCHLFSLGELSL